MVKKENKKFSKVVLATIVGVSAIVGATGGALIAYNPYDSTDLKVAQNVAFKAGQDSVEPVLVPVVKTITETVEVEKLVEVEKEIFVDNGDLAFVLERLEDKLVIEDAEEIVEELKAEDTAIKGAFDYVDAESKELFDLLEEEGIISDEDEVEIVKVYNDFEDVEIITSDFDDEEYEFKLTYKVEDLDEEEKFKINVTVKVEDGEFEILSVSKQ